MARLADFVSSTINEIIEGVLTAQTLSAARGAKVNPKGVLIGRTVLETSLHDSKTNILADMIEFDLCVTVDQGKQTKGTIGIVVAAIGLGSQGTSSKSTSQQNRIRFRIPVQLPVQS